MKNVIRKTNRAFTLAEVLITLGVIGVVAALTLPTLINEHRISQWETALKRDYTVLSQGFRKMMADYGCDTIECTGVFTTTTDEEGNVLGDHDKLDQAIRSTFHVVKSYKRGEFEQRTIKYLKGTNSSLSSTSSYYFVLNDGAIVRIYVPATGNCSFSGNVSCAYLDIDVNGLLPPNTFGKDSFALGNLYNNGTIVPDWSRQWSIYASRPATDYWKNNNTICGTPNKKLKDETITSIVGQNCLARIMENNWRMDYLH